MSRFGFIVFGVFWGDGGSQGRSATSITSMFGFFFCLRSFSRLGRSWATTGCIWISQRDWKGERDQM